MGRLLGEERRGIRAVRRSVLVLGVEPGWPGPAGWRAARTTATPGFVIAARAAGSSTTLAAALTTFGSGDARASRSCAASRRCIASTPSLSRSARTVRRSTPRCRRPNRATPNRAAPRASARSSSCRRPSARSRRRVRWGPSPQGSRLHSGTWQSKRPIEPPATIGILGGGQLGRMLGMAARAMGYRVAVLDPDPDCPAAAIADLVVVGGYDDVDAALRLAEVERRRDLRARARGGRGRRGRRGTGPGPARARAAARDPGSTRRAPVRRAGRDRRRAVARGPDPSRRRGQAAEALGLPLRLKLPTGGYDGRGQIRIADRRRARRCLGAPRRRTWRGAARRAGARVRDGAVGHRRARVATRSRSSRSAGTSMTPGSWCETGVPAPVDARGRGGGGRDRDVARGGDGPAGDADRGALPDARRARSSSTSWRRASTTPATGRSRAPRPPSSSSTSGRSAGWGSGRRPLTVRRRWSTCSGPARGARRGCWAWPRRSPIRPSTSISTTSARSSNVARWATSRRSGPRWTRRSRAVREALTKLHWADDTTKTEDDR